MKDPDPTRGIDGDWVRREVLDEVEFRRQFAHNIPVARGAIPGAYARTEITRAIAATRTPSGNIEELARTLLRDAQGRWFFAGWHDQAVLHVGFCCLGGAAELPAMLEQFDRDPVDQSGDMLIGFCRDDESMMFTVEVSPDEDVFEAFLRTDSESEAEAARRILDAAESAPDA